MKITEIDAITNERVEREATAEEQEQFAADMAEINAKQATVSEAKAALLKRLGITADEAALLLG